MSTRYRNFQPVDTDAVLALWDKSRSTGFEPVYSLAEVLASCNEDHAIVAYDSTSIIGVAVGRVAHEQGWVVLLVVDENYRGLGIGGRLLGELEIDMAKSGITKLSMLVADDGKSGVLEKAGFIDLKHLKYFEREVSVSERERELLRELGGRVLERDLWDKIAGMKNEKELLERRLVLPLSDSKLAEAFGVEPPKAIVLFGPPGTGKTTFAKAVASRLDWPFIEFFPSRLGGDVPAAYAFVQSQFPDVRAAIKPFFTHFTAGRTTELATAHAVTDVVGFIGGGTKMAIPAQVLLEGEWPDLHGPVAVPVLTDPTGWSQVVPEEISAEEQTALVAAVDAISALNASAS